MKRVFFLILFIAAAVFALHGCDSSKNKNNKQVKIGISKIIVHPALDAIEQGIIDELNHQGFNDIVYDLQSANGEYSTAISIANRFRSEGVDIAVGIATPTSVALANQIKDRPVIFSGVTDALGSGLRRSLDTYDTNITGVSDMAPVREQVLLFLSMKDIKVMGHIYSPGESNSAAQLDMLREVCSEKGIELFISPVNNTSEVKQAAEIVAARADGIFVSHDNTVVAALSSLTDSAKKYNVPVFSSDPSSAQTGDVTVAYGVDNYQTGRAAGMIIADILRGAKPSDIPVKLMTEPHELTGYVSMEQVEKYGLKLPAVFAGQ